MHPADTHRRLIERRLAMLAVGLVALFAGVVLMWRLVYDDAPWPNPFPPMPAMSGWDAFNLYLWVGPIGTIVAAAMVLGIFIRGITGRAGATRWIGVVLPVLVCLQTAAIYAPYGAMTSRRSDRLLRSVEEPLVAGRALVLSVVVTMILLAAFVVITQLQRTPNVVRVVGLSVAALLSALLLNLSWLLWILPMTNGWNPVDGRRPELLTAVRPCRGALLWSAPERGGENRGWTYPVARIDDVWLHFADPTAPGGSVWAVSGSGESREGYYWFRRADVEQLRVRVDDPALVRCDSRPRPEGVAPEPWHQMGID